LTARKGSPTRSTVSCVIVGATSDWPTARLSAADLTLIGRYLDD
jgi:hypothetical protein